ncbi:hypothetical protein Q4R98_18010 [Morganella morganii]
MHSHYFYILNLPVLIHGSSNKAEATIHCHLLQINGVRHKVKKYNAATDEPDNKGGFVKNDLPPDKVNKKIIPTDTGC